MKILWLSHLIPYPPKGGVLQRSYHLVRELSRYHEVDLLCFNQKALMRPQFKSHSEGLKEACAALGEICGRFAYFDIPSDSSFYSRYFLALRSLFGKPYTINWLKSKEYAYTLDRWLQQKNYDLVHFDTISLVPYFQQLAGGVSTSLDHHNIESHMLLRRAKNETNWLKRFYFWQEGRRLSRYEWHYCPRFSVNITCSELDKDRLLSFVPHACVATIPNGVDLSYFSPQGRPVEPNRIIFVGRMSAYPNIEAALYIGKKLWPVLKQRHPDLICDIVGANPPESILSLAADLPDFHVHGFVDDVRPFIEVATVYICPIRDGGGTKLKILDAMAMNKAIVAHPVACEGIKVAHGHNVLLAETEKEFVENIDDLLGSEEKRKNIGSEARQLIEREFDYRVIGEQLSNVFYEYSC